MTGAPKVVSTDVYLCAHEYCIVHTRVSPMTNMYLCKRLRPPPARSAGVLYANHTHHLCARHRIFHIYANRIHYLCAHHVISFLHLCQSYSLLMRAPCDFFTRMPIILTIYARAPWDCFTRMPIILTSYARDMGIFRTLS